jgi:hypothetical protein
MQCFVVALSCQSFVTDRQWKLYQVSGFNLITERNQKGHCWDYCPYSEVNFFAFFSSNFFFLFFMKKKKERKNPSCLFVWFEQRAKTFFWFYYYINNNNNYYYHLTVHLNLLLTACLLLLWPWLILCGTVFILMCVLCKLPCPTTCSCKPYRLYALCVFG